MASHVYCGNPGALSWCVADIDSVLEQSCPSKNRAHNHKSYQREGRRETRREGAPLGYSLRTTYKSSSAVGLLNLTRQHGFAACIQHAITAVIMHCQKMDCMRMVLYTVHDFMSGRGDKWTCHMSQYL